MKNIVALLLNWKVHSSVLRLPCYQTFAIPENSLSFHQKNQFSNVMLYSRRHLEQITTQLRDLNCVPLYV